MVAIPIIKIKVAKWKVKLAAISVVCGYLTSRNEIISSPITTIVKHEINKMTRENYPNIIIYDADDNVVQILSERQLPSISRAMQKKEHSFNFINDAKKEEGDCVPTHSWHEESFEQCNNLHELDLSRIAIDGSLIHLASGYDRSVFRIKTTSGDDVAFKTLKYRHDIDDLRYYLAEGKIMAVTNSPYILQSYSYCSISNLIELGSGGHLQQRTVYARESRIETLKPIDKLKVAIQMATAVADLHEAGVAHADLYLSQYVEVDGIYKLTDFHMSNFLTKKKDNGEICPDVVEFWEDEAYLHPPELKLNGKGVAAAVESAKRDGIELDPKAVAVGDSAKGDDFMLGNDLYGLLTNLRLFENSSFARKPAIKTQMVQYGRRSMIPDSIANSKDPALQAVVSAIKMVWIQEPSNRKTSRQIAVYLRNKLEEIEGDKAVGSVVRISGKIPDIPKDFKFPKDDDLLL